MHSRFRTISGQATIYINSEFLTIEGKREADAVQASKFHGMSWSI